MTGQCKVTFTFPVPGVAELLVVVQTHNEFLEPPYIGYLWEFRPFYYRIMTRAFCKWLAGSGRTSRAVSAQTEVGSAAVQLMAQRFLPNTPAIFVTQKRVGRNTVWKSKAHTQSMVSSSWLLAFVLATTARGGKLKVKTKAWAVLTAIVSFAFTGTTVSVAHPLACCVASPHVLLRKVW